jgi:dihydrodipicolinate synthase/N-acetylneuraminate lyase
MFRGCGTALVTPFRSDLSLDEEVDPRLDLAPAATTPAR